MDIRIFDNFEDDGQLTLFGLEEDFEELQMPVEEPAEAISGESAAEEPMSGKKAAGKLSSAELPAGEQISGERSSGQNSVGVRIRNCSSCGKLLFVKEEDGGYVSACNACGIQYVQK